jgi:hypothetical protein
LEAKLINLALTAKNFEASRPDRLRWENNPKDSSTCLILYGRRYGGIFSSIKNPAPPPGPVITSRQGKICPSS